MPANYITVGAGLTMWVCNNYPSATLDGKAGPNAVLGIQLVGRRMIIDEQTGAVTYGDVITVDNSGVCGTNILLAKDAGGSYYTNLATPGEYYPPIVGNATTTYDALQVSEVHSTLRICSTYALLQTYFV
jgi:hypothetical protein